MLFALYNNYQNIIKNPNIHFKLDINNNILIKDDVINNVIKNLITKIKSKINTKK